MKLRKRVSASVLGCAAIVAVVGCDQNVDAIGLAAAEQQLLSSEIENPEACPDTPDAAMQKADDYLEDALCNGVPDGTLCAYNIPNGWAGYVCGCYTENVWQRIGLSGPPEMASPGGCPDGIPVDDTRCGDETIGPCLYFPNLFATCDTGLWQVWELGREHHCTRLDANFP